MQRKTVPVPPTKKFCRVALSNTASRDFKVVDYSVVEVPVAEINVNLIPTIQAGECEAHLVGGIVKKKRT
jgi:hypothetical protein